MEKVLVFKCVGVPSVRLAGIYWFTEGNKYPVVDNKVKDDLGYYWDYEVIKSVADREVGVFSRITQYKFEKLYTFDCIEANELDKILKSGDIIVREVTIKGTGKTAFICDIALMDTEVGNVVRMGVTDVQGVVKRLDEYLKEWSDNIVKVVTPKHLAFWYHTAMFDRLATQDETRFGVHKVKWERKKVEPKEMTVAEIEKILGYEVKVVKEK